MTSKLVAAGVPKDPIVLAFHSPQVMVGCVSDNITHQDTVIGVTA
ncbi:hypothetical protein [Microseira wollei]|nr:hypothetical protein [Microseira wollei]